MLEGKTVILGVAGSIAAYKIASLASLLVKQHAEVHVIMTQNATNFIRPTTFETLTAHKCLVDTFDRDFEFHVAHVNLAQKADVMLIAPATANGIGKLANGIADDMLTTTALACKAPLLVAPAMNTSMYENPVVQDNLERLKQYGMEIIEPDTGMLACRDIGPGKMAEPEVLYQYLLRAIAKEKDLTGKRVLVTAGPTQEAIDPVRYITNHSSGKMGYAIAKEAMLRGADVTLVTGPCAMKPPLFVTVCPVTSAQEMYEETVARQSGMDFIFMAAAVADYRPDTVSEEKIKKTDGSSTLTLVRTNDILQTLGENKQKGQILCGFSMETEDVRKHSREKLLQKNLDLIVANNLRTEGAGFGTDTNVVTILMTKGEKELPLMSKESVAEEIVNEALQRTQ